MTIVGPRHAQVYYDDEDSYGDGGSGGDPDWKWIGMIQDSASLTSYSKMAARGLGSVDASAIRAGMKKPELNLKWIVQKKRTVAVAFDPKVFLKYAHTFPTYGVGIEVLYTYATSTYYSLWFKGMLFNKLSLEWTIDGWVTASAQFYGQNMVPSDAQSGTSPTYESNPLNLANSYAVPLTGFDTEVFFDVDAGGDASAADIKRVKIDIDNKLVRRPAIQASNPELLKYMARGARELSGEMTIYFSNHTYYDYVLGNNKLDIMFDLEKVGNTPRFDFTGCKFDDAVLSTRITEFPCEITLPFTATALAVT